MTSNLVSLAVVLVLAAAACGGSGEGDGAETTVAATSGTTLPGAEVVTTHANDGDEPESDEDEPESNNDSEPAGSAVNTAVITIGDHNYEFEWPTDALQLCEPDFFGAFVAVSTATSDTNSFESEFPPPDDPELMTPKIEVSDRENSIHWTADPEETIATTVESWPAQVDSYQIDGNTVSGTATFVGPHDQLSGEPPEGVQGNFEITCAPENSE